MARTYWTPKEGGAYEFLGAFRDGHVAHKSTPQAKGAIVDITDLDVPGVEVKLRLSERDAGPPVLQGLPTAITKRFAARMPASLPWALVEGLVK